MRLDNVEAILSRVLTSLDRNPKLLESVGKSLERVSSGAQETLGSVGEGIEEVGSGAGKAAGELGEGAGKAAGGVAKGARGKG